jgi:ankyrin repeat protein
LYPQIQGADTDAVERRYKGSALLLAAENRENEFQEVVKLLLRSGANVDARDSSGETALHKAAEAGDIDLVRLLISKKARLNVKNRIGRSALDLACRKNRSKVIEHLLRSGATFEPDIYGRTALHGAIEGGCDAAIIELFVSRGVDINAKAQSGSSKFSC